MLKKISKKKLIIISSCLFLILIGSAVFFLSKDKNDENVEEKIVLKQGQSLVYGQIASIYGNEVTYYVMEEKEDTKSESENLKDGEDKKTQALSEEKSESAGEGISSEESSESNRSEIPGGESGERPQMPLGEGGERPQMPMGEEGERPQMPSGGRGQRSQSTEESSAESVEEGIPSEESSESERPQMPSGESGERPQMPSGEMPWMTESEGGRLQMEQGNGMQVTEQTVTVQIPVGTQVTTRLGTVTTFSRLAAGDNIKMLVQEEDGKQVILEMWIVD